MERKKLTFESQQMAKKRARTPPTRDQLQWFFVWKNDEEKGFNLPVIFAEADKWSIKRPSL